ncbi:MAG: PAS domain S-box protein [Chloroflexi bacterium]|nr:PAS domain S-box protein [Chloroflexota bacterium]
MEKKLCLLVCNNIKAEVEACVASEKWDDVMVAAYPADCSRPGVPAVAKMKKLIARCQERYSLVYLLGGCCTAGASGGELESKGCRVHPAGQCFYLFAPRATIDSYLEKGAYLLTPGWLLRWRQQMVGAWGFDRATAREFFAESVTRLVMLDTGVYEKSQERLRQSADFLGLPREAAPVGLDFLRLTLTGIVLEWRLASRKEESAAALARAEKRAADYATMLDVIGDLSQVTTEKETIERIFYLFSLLFSPGRLFNIPVHGEEMGEVQSSHSAPADGAAVTIPLAALRQGRGPVESGTGFVLPVTWRGEILGILDVGEFSIPQYRESYLDTARELSNVCGLAISRARAYEKIRQAENALRLSEQKYRTIFENTGTATVLLDGDGTIALVNAEFEKLSGYSREEIEGKKTYTEFAVKEDLEMMRGYHESRLADPESAPKKYETRFVDRSGAVKDIAVTVDVIPGTQRSVASLSDITESKDLVRLKDEFVSFVSHEIRTPLTVIVGGLGTVLSAGGLLSQEQTRDLVQDACSEAEALSELVENLLELSRAQADRLQLRVEPLDIAEVVKGQLQRVLRQCSSAPVHQFASDLPPALPPVKGDRVRIERILFNLLENAVKYSPAGGEIRVSVGVDGDGMKIGVHDQGIGMTPEQQAKLFRRFERLGLEMGSGIRGTGIGLTVCLRLVEAHGGRMWVESEKGKGSSFYFTLPL